MFIGHFGVAMAAKRVTPRTSLATLVMAAQFLDLIWPFFLLAGWERVRIVPGITRLSPFDFEYPISHSLLTAAGWAAGFGLLYFLRRRELRGAGVTGLLVVIHWFMDAAVHRPDLPLTPFGSTRIGLGWWNSLGATLAVELGLFVAGLGLYVSATVARRGAGSWALWSFVLTLLGLWLGSLFGPPPPNPQMLTFIAFGTWLTVAWAGWIERNRAMKA